MPINVNNVIGTVMYSNAHQNKIGSSNIMKINKTNATKSAIGLTNSCNRIGAKNHSIVAVARIPKITVGIITSNAAKATPPNNKPRIAID